MVVRTRMVSPRLRTEWCREAEKKKNNLEPGKGEDNSEKEERKEEEARVLEVVYLRQEHLQWNDPILARHSSMEIMAAQEGAIDW